MKFFLFPASVLSVVFFSCKSSLKKADYETPFYKAYTGTIKDKAYTLQLYRDSAYHSITYKAILTDTLQQLPLSFSGAATDSADKSKVTMAWAQTPDTVYQLNGNISGDAETFSGTWYKLAGEKKIDSAAFSFAVNNDETLFDYYSAEENMAAKSGYHGRTGINFVWPRKWPDSVAEKAVKKQIAKQLGIGDTASNPLQTYLAKAHTDFLSTYGDMGTNGGGEMEESADDDVSISLAYQNSRWLVLENSSEHYESGMNHPQGGTAYYNLHRKSGRELQLNDFFLPEGLRALPKLVEKYFRLQNNLKPNEPLTKAGLFQNRIAPNKNFYVTSKQLVFHYGNYEIAPFAMGEFDVQIPIDEIPGGLAL